MSATGSSRRSAPSGLGVPTRRRLLGTVLVTAAAAALVLVIVVLPAEYQIDPTGLGSLLGLDRIGAGGGGMAPLAEAPSGFVTNQPRPFRSETLRLELRPQEQMELKLAMSEGDVVVYSWQVDRGFLYSDFHAEPYGEPEGGAIRYRESDGVAAANGSVIAPFSGHHGWYWVNPNAAPVVVTLELAGYYDAVKERRAP